MPELILNIYLGESPEQFEWDDFKSTFEEDYQGTLSKSESSESRNYWLMQWSGNESNFEDVVSSAERGRIDRWITNRNNGIGCLVELTAENKECVYSYVPEIKLEEKKIHNIPVNEVKELASQVDVLLMTATEIERKTVLAEMEAWPEREEILQGSLSRTTFNFGRFGRYRTAHVECTMGAEGSQDAMLTIERGITELKPKVVLVLGIAFGIDLKKQRLGDVIIAESVYPYDARRVGETSNIQKGTSIQCGSILSERFRTRRSGWKLDCGIRPVKVHRGPILSGGILLDNKEFRDQLVNDCCKTAQGGEMEGAGAYKAAQGSGAEIILIKGICDWGDGHKNDRAQPFAAHAAVSLAKHVLNQPDVLTQLEAVDLESGWSPDPRSHPEDSKPSPLIKVSQLLFQETKAKISLAKKYKSLHDDFQELQSWKNMVNDLFVMLSKLPNNDAYLLRLHNHVNNIVGELEDEEIRSEIRARRIVWQETLSQAEDKFNQAIRQKDQKKLKDSIELIEAVLYPGLSLMNDRLVNTVKELQLHQSIETLKILREEKIFQQFSPDQLVLFDQKLQDLKNTEESLEAVLPIHNDFQGIDNELHHINRELSSIGVDVTQMFPLHWKILERMLQELCGDREDEWANQLRQQRQELESAVTEKDASKIKERFQPLRSIINVEFNTIDKELKDICENLKNSGDVLDAVLKMI